MSSLGEVPAACADPDGKRFLMSQQLYNEVIRQALVNVL